MSSTFVCFVEFLARRPLVLDGELLRPLSRKHTECVYTRSQKKCDIVTPHVNCIFHITCTNGSLPVIWHVRVLVKLIGHGRLAKVGDVKKGNQMFFTIMAFRCHKSEAGSLLMDARTVLAKKTKVANQF